MIRPFPLLVLLFSSVPSSSSLGRRKLSTRPLDKPTVSSGFDGCRTWVKRSADSGSVQRFSSMV